MTTGTWNTSTSVGGYTQSNYSHSAAGSGENVITWQLPVAQPGVYEIYAHWTAHPNRAFNAAFEVNAGGQTTAVVVDQRINGGSHQLLGAFSLTAGDTLSLSNDADGYVIADGILVLPPNAAPSTATWTLTAVETGEYQLAANWTAHSNRASNATYTITTAVGLQTVVMDQRQSGGNWNVLGTVNLAAGESATVSLTDVADGYVIADAIQMISTAAPPNQVVWHPGLSNVGEYEVYARWSAHPNRATDATYRIQHEGGESGVTVNQQASGGSWNYLGNFELGPDSQILLSDEANGFVVADAIQLSWAGGVVPGEETRTLYYVHTDHLGTPQVVTDGNQVVRWRAVYAPFGEVELVVEDIEMPVRFPGQYYDRETGLHYNYFRDYDPTRGRYVQSDPIGLRGGLNSYGYAMQNSTIGIDPFGLASVFIWYPGPFSGLNGNGSSAGGHVAVMTADGTYVSHHPRNAFSDHTSEFREYQQDRSVYGRDADVIVNIPLGDEEKASQRARESLRDPTWSPYNNCVDTTELILKAGGRRDVDSSKRPFLLSPNQRQLNNLGISTPTGLANYLLRHNQGGWVLQNAR